MLKSPICTRARKNQLDVTDLMDRITKVESGMKDIEEMKTRLESAIEDVEKLKERLEKCIRSCDNSFLTATDFPTRIIQDAPLPVPIILHPDILESEIEAGKLFYR